jgi:uncharacterized protein YjbJ (UPF0337 family)
MSSNTQDEVKKAADDAAHSGKADQAKGYAKETAGAVRAKVGSFIGDEEMEAKGRMQQAEGKADRLKGEVKEKIEDVKDHVKAGIDAVKDKIDEVRKR